MPESDRTQVTDLKDNPADASASADAAYNEIKDVARGLVGAIRVNRGFAAAPPPHTIGEDGWPIPGTEDTLTPLPDGGYVLAMATGQKRTISPVEARHLAEQGRHAAEKLCSILTYPPLFHGAAVDMLGSDKEFAEQKAANLQASGWRLVRRRVHIGYGEETLWKAADALQNWRMHELAGVRADHDGAATPGETIMLRVGPTASPCVVVDAWRLHNMATLIYGTNRGHPMKGEEAFSVVMEPSEEVVANLVAFSKPATLAAKVGLPVMRMAQTLITERYVAALGKIGK